MAQTTTLDLAHFSLQHSDPTSQKQHDAVKIFSRNYAAIFGTEAGEEDTKRVLRVAAHNAGYMLFIRLGNWVCVRRNLIMPNTYRTGYKVFVDNDELTVKQYHLNAVWAQCTMKNIGKVTFIASHYSIKGRPDAKTAEYRQNLEANKKLAHGIGDLADKMGAGSALVFYGGDQNIIDKKNDTFFGESLTSAWDELKRWENTGHGNIDVIASYDKDRRVRAKYIRALDDKEQFMYTDHFPVEAGFTVRNQR